MNRTLTTLAVLLVAGCASSTASTSGKTPAPPVADPTPGCPSEADANVRYWGRTAAECEGMALSCEEGYGFYDDACGCGCVVEAALPAGHDPAACTADADCGLTCMNPGSCCDQLCTCDNAYTVDTIQRLAAWKERRCEHTVCPVAGCLPTEVQHRAACVGGRCVAVEQEGAAEP